MITTRDLSFKSILHGIDLDIPDHGITGLVGPNGSGKTTLLRCLFGALQPTAGEVLINGSLLKKLSARDIAKSLSVVSQDNDEPPQMTVAEVVRLGRLPHRDNNETKVLEALEQVGLTELATRFLPTLSGGERQRAMIARAFAQDTPHMLLDEPTNHLDIRYTLDVFHSISHYQGSVTVVLHDLNAALEYCDHVYLLNYGKIVASGPPDQVLVPAILEPVYNVAVTRTRDHLQFERLQP
ncbi:ABC transporter ATP-binding protein [Corynebacterium lubricantis]|uniref:ABC transporter ATP-binding protein n=1 Tax=Corynebacterium lubricantis TaxID=541095 RepID=UPI0003616B67|nr:ABC transporter ATP-binding protein [Corynebacterium lubricantis]